MKEKLARVVTAVAIIAVTTGCQVEQQKVLTPTPVYSSPGLGSPEGPPIIIPLETEWSNLSALERIKRLEFKEYPQFPNFDPQKELVASVAQFYCEKTKCRKQPEEIARNVSFLPSERFFQELEREQGRSLSKEEKEEYVSIEFTVKKTGRVFVNEDVMREIVVEVQRSQPDIVRRLGKRDLTVVMWKSILIHSFFHVNVSEEVYFFEPFSLRLPGEVGPINIMQLGHGFSLIGLRSNGQQFIMNGADEAMSELGASELAGRDGAYLHLVPELADAATLVDAVNKKAGISAEEFLRYLSGELPKETFLQKWGALKNPANPDEKAALLTLTTVALRADDLTTQDGARREIEGYLGIKFTR